MIIQNRKDNKSKKDELNERIERVTCLQAVLKEEVVKAQTSSDKLQKIRQNFCPISHILYRRRCG